MQNIDSSVFVHPSAHLYGGIEIGEGSSVWPNVVMRAEANTIRIGRMTNVQDFVMIHVAFDEDTVIGDFCSITHHVTIHGATVEDECLIGIGATIMDGARIGKGSIVAGGTFIPEGKEYPPNSIIMGSPGKVRAERESGRANRLNAWLYNRNANAYAAGDHRAWTGPDFADWYAAKRAEVSVDDDL